jgi:hypothetical protein
VKEKCLAMKNLSFEQMENISGGINWHSLGCGLGIGLIFGISALGGPAGVAVAALVATSAGSVLCAAIYDED